jgi:hypothetical protein
VSVKVVRLAEDWQKRDWQKRLPVGADRDGSVRAAGFVIEKGLAEAVTGRSVFHFCQSTSHPYFSLVSSLATALEQLGIGPL